jgi:hypothetical protein
MCGNRNLSPALDDDDDGYEENESRGIYHGNVLLF